MRHRSLEVDVLETLPSFAGEKFKRQLLDEIKKNRGQKLDHPCECILYW